MSEVKVVGRGVDTLVLNTSYGGTDDKPIKQELAADLQAQLSQLQEEARTREAEVSTPWMFKGFHLWMQPKGSRGQWKWILRCPFLSLAISRGLLSPIIAQVRLSSEYLWSCETVADAIVETLLLLYDLFGESIWVQVSEVDLCADLIGWDVARSDWQQCFISRAVGQNARPADVPLEGADVARLRWKQVATLDFGKHTSPISCCIYHKSAEIRLKSPTKVWFHDLWKRNGWDGSAEVWRIEFRLIREFLHSVHIEHVYDLPDRLAALWTYCAGRPTDADGFPSGWLRYVVPTKDKTRARWPIDPAWAVVQGAFSQEDDGLGPVVRERIREKNIWRGLASVMGYLSTLSAWVGGDLASEEVDVSHVLHWLHDAGLDFLDKQGIDFAHQVELKCKLYRSVDELVS